MERKDRPKLPRSHIVVGILPDGTEHPIRYYHAKEAERATLFALSIPSNDAGLYDGKYDDVVVRPSALEPPKPKSGRLKPVPPFRAQHGSRVSYVLDSRGASVLICYGPPELRNEITGLVLTGLGRVF